jgi:hypothetical protein
MRWWERGEWADAIGDIQASVDMRDTSAGDVIGQDSAIAQMQMTGLGEPPKDFTVRAVYDSRFPNSYDFNIAALSTQLTSTNPTYSVSFQCPNGYRMVPRKWNIYISNPPSGPPQNSYGSLQQNGVNIPYNDAFYIGVERQLETFFLVEETTTFGLTGFNANYANAITNPTVIVEVYGNLIPTTHVALPFAVTNESA